MNWVAIDLGSSMIKASVLDGRNRSVRLSYPMGGYNTTLLSAGIVITDNGEVIVGDYATQLGICNPEMKVFDWKHSFEKVQIAKSFFETIKKAAIKHYSDNQIGGVLLYDDNCDKQLLDAANDVFYEVKSMQAADVIKRFIAPQQNELMLIMDFGEQAFRITIIDNGRILSSVQNQQLGFLTIDMLSLLNCEQYLLHNNVKRALFGQVIQRMKISLNNGEPIMLPKGVFAKGKMLVDDFQQKMIAYFYQCFEECFNALKGVLKSWENVNDVVFIGGGAHSQILDSVFEKYMQDYYSIESYNRKNRNFDAQFAASHCAIQMPLRSKVRVIIKY